MTRLAAHPPAADACAADPRAARLAAAQCRASVASQEVLLAELAGEHPHERTLVAHVHLPGQASQLHLRQQSWAEGIGWFTQSSVQLAPAQVQALRLALGQAPRSTPPAGRTPRAGGFVPRLVQADSA